MIWHFSSSIFSQIALFLGYFVHRPAARKEQTTNDIMHHIWYCISPVETCVRMTICNSVLMDRLNQAQKPVDTATAVKLLLQTQAAEKKN